MSGRIMRRRTVLLVLAFTAASAMPGAGDVHAQRATDRFEFRSAPKMALHYFLLSWATDEAGEWPDWAVPIRERWYWRAELTDEDARRWAGTVQAYRAAVGRNLLFDRGLIAVRDRLGGEADADVPESDRPLLEAVETALPVYLAHWWPEHDRRNQAWIEAVTATLEAVEEDVISRLEAAYGRSWPGWRVPVDIVPYTHALGAYSTAGRVAISSSDPSSWMPQAVEIVFHEASHLGPLEQGVRGGLRVAYEAAGEEAPGRLWHDMIFFTTGETVRLALEAAGQPGYQHYKTHDYENDPRWRALVPALREHWQPFLLLGSDAPEDRRRALEALANALLGREGPR